MTGIVQPSVHISKENVKKPERFLKRLIGMAENLLYREPEETVLLHMRKVFNLVYKYTKQSNG